MHPGVYAVAFRDFYNLGMHSYYISGRYRQAKLFWANIMFLLNFILVNDKKSLYMCIYIHYIYI